MSNLKRLIASLQSTSSEWFFDSRVSAQFYASESAKLDDAVYDSLKGAAMLRSVGECIKFAMNTDILSMNDLFTTDQEALGKLSARMNGMVSFKDDKDDYEALVH